MTGGRARLLRYLGLAVAAAVLIFVIIAARPREVWGALGDVQGTKPWIVIALNPVMVTLWTARSMLVLRQMGHSISPAVLLPVTVLGNVAGSLTPGGSGEVLRAAALQRTAGLRLGESVSLVVYERVLSTYLLLLSTVACFALVSLASEPGLAITALCLGLVLLPWVSARTILPRLPASTSIETASLPKKVFRYGLQLAEETQVLFWSLPLLLAWSTLTLASFAVTALQFALVAGSIGSHIDMLEGWVAFGGSGFAVIASLLPLGVGVGDGSLAAIIHEVGDVPFDRATAVAVFVRATITLPLLVLAFVSYLWLARTRPEVVKSDMES